MGMNRYGQYKNCAYCNTHGLIIREFYGNMYYDECRNCGGKEDITPKQFEEDLDRMETDKRFVTIRR